MASDPAIFGHVASGFEPVRAAFEENFRLRGEIGAACAAVVEGEVVVDLWGGVLDAARPDEPWREDSLVVVYSMTKGLAAMVVALAHSRGQIDYDAPVAQYWQEFAQNGKDRVTVRQLLGHEAGLCAIDESLHWETLADLDRLASILAKQKPAWRVGERHGYHSLSIGLYENELVRRVDPAHRTIGQILREDVCEPLDAELYIGLPQAVPEDRLATLHAGARADMFRALDTLTPAFVFASVVPGNITYKTFRNPRLKSALELAARPWLDLELAAANGVASARGAAKAYGAFAVGGGKLGISKRTLDELEAEPPLPRKGRLRDAVLRTDTKFSLGFWKPYAGYPFGSDHRAYGTPGAGGSMAFADPSTRLGFAYTPNKLGLHMWNDPREASLRDAIYRCLGVDPGTSHTAGRNA